VRAGGPGGVVWVGALGRGGGREAAAGRRGAARRDGEDRGGRRIDGDAGRRAVDRAGDRVGRGDRPASGRLQRVRVRERVGAVVAAHEGVVRGERRLAVGAREVDRARVAGRSVVRDVEGGDGDGRGAARGDR